MKTIEKMVQELDATVTSLWEEYVLMHRELTEYMQTHLVNGILQEKDVEPVNQIISRIQDLYSAIHPAFHWNIHKNEFTKNAMIGHQEFINNLKTGGAKEHKEEATA